MTKVTQSSSHGAYGEEEVDIALPPLSPSICVHKQSNKHRGIAEQLKTANYYGHAKQPKTANYYGHAKQPKTANYYGHAKQPKTANYSGFAEQPKTVKYYGHAEQPKTANYCAFAEQQKTANYYDHAEQQKTAKMNGKLICASAQISAVQLLNAEKMDEMIRINSNGQQTKNAAPEPYHVGMENEADAVARSLVHIISKERALNEVRNKNVLMILHDKDETIALNEVRNKKVLMILQSKDEIIENLKVMYKNYQREQMAIIEALSKQLDEMKKENKELKEENEILFAQAPDDELLEEIVAGLKKKQNENYIQSQEINELNGTQPLHSGRPNYHCGDYNLMSATRPLVNGPVNIADQKNEIEDFGKNHSANYVVPIQVGMNGIICLKEDAVAKDVRQRTQSKLFPTLCASNDQIVTNIMDTVNDKDSLLIDKEMDKKIEDVEIEKEKQATIQLFTRKPSKSTASTMASSKGVGFKGLMLLIVMLLFGYSEDWKNKDLVIQNDTLTVKDSMNIIDCDVEFEHLNQSKEQKKKKMKGMDVHYMNLSNAPHLDKNEVGKQTQREPHTPPLCATHLWILFYAIFGVNAFVEDGLYDDGDEKMKSLKKREVEKSLKEDEKSYGIWRIIICFCDAVLSGFG